MRRGPRSGCAINAAVEALGDQWSLIVLRDMMFGEYRHFRELLDHSEEGIASNILSSRLKSLVAGGLLTRQQAGRGHRVTYGLTEAGIQTLPVMVALGSWGLRHRPTTPELGIRARLLEEGGPRLWEDLMDELREAHLDVPARTPTALDPPNSSGKPTSRREAARGDHDNRGPTDTSTIRRLPGSDAATDDTAAAFVPKHSNRSNSPPQFAEAGHLRAQLRAARLPPGAVDIHRHNLLLSPPSAVKDRL